ncbi:VWA domain-containing protein [Dysosmobacter sp. Phy]
MTQEELIAKIQQYPWIDRFVYVTGSGSELDVQIKWPEAELAAASYNAFYTGLFSAVFGKENVDYLKPLPSDYGGDLEFSRSHGVGDYLPGTALYEETNSYFASLTEDGFQDGETLEIWSGYGIDAPGAGNVYANYEFTYYNVIELEQLDTSYTVRHEYYTNDKLTGSTESDPVTGLLVGSTVSVADIEQVPSYQGGDYEYTSTTPNETLTLTSNAADNVIVLRYDRTVEVEEPTFEWDTSKSKTATPLDEDLKSQVTLSLPSAEETLESDIVFVVDKSTSSRDESTEGGLAMLEALNSSLESTKAVINVGIVVFDGTYHVMRELSPYDAADVAEKMSARIPLEEDTSGTNIEAGLLAAQAMLEEHTSVANNRKYVILVSDGLTRLFTGPDGETVQIIFNQLEADGTRYFGEYTTWCLSNRLGDGEYKVPGGVDWLTYYTTVIKPQVEADGDTYVMDFTGASTMTDTVPEKYIPLDEVQDHAQAIDRAFYDAYQAYLDLSTAYHCYAIYTGSSELGSSFMSTLSNGETLDFDDIQNDILYAVDKGSYVVDYIGYVAGSYDFDFVNDVSAMSLKVGETTYPAVRLTDNRYGFKPVGDGTYAFTLEYERGNGLNEEHFTWTIGEAVSNFAPVQLTYTVKLVTPPTEPGDYKLDTNQIATLHPVNSDGTPGDPEDFEKPTVDYTVGGGTGPEGPGTDPTPPGGTDPTPPGGDGGTDIPDGNTPTTDLPDQETPTTELPEEETPTTELPDEETPLAEVPETGDMSALWLAMTALSGTGLAGVTFLGRKKRDEE